MNKNTALIIDLSDGQRSSIDIAKIVGLSPRYVRKVQARYDLPRLNVGARNGQKNHMYKTGRVIDHDGYALVKAPQGHPYARKFRHTILEHRLVMEQKLGRYLDPIEVVDHIDGLTLHNSPDNLRLFQDNAEHLKETLKNRKKNWSRSGYQNIGTRSDLGRDYQPVDNYHQNKAQGDVRLRQVLLAALVLGIDNPHLLGTHQYLEREQIDYSSRTNLERALDSLEMKLAERRSQ